MDHVVKNCRECQSIDPSSTRIDGGELNVPDDWRQVAVNVTHYDLQTYEKKGAVHWRRTKLKEDVEPINLNSMTKRQIFSLCGKLVGHYPVAGWLRVASSFVKRGCQGNAWDSFADRVAIERLKEVLTRLKADDPVKGVWSVSPTGVTNIWCDASKIAYGVALERGDEIIEDGAWLRKANDGTHINLAELNAVIKGVNLSMKWGATNVAIMTDSAAVHSWMSSMLEGQTY